MEKVNDLKENVTLKLPIRINYKVLEGFLREELVGEVLREESKNGDGAEYALIQAVSLRKSWKENFDLSLILRVKTLTSFFKNHVVRMTFHAALEFNRVDQEVFVHDYELEGENRGWLMNKFIQLVANTFMYSSLKKRMRFNMKPILDKKIAELNQKFSEEAEVFKGIGLKGQIKHFQISDIIPGEAHLLVMVEGAATTLINVQEINFQLEL